MTTIRIAITSRWNCSLSCEREFYPRLQAVPVSRAIYLSHILLLMFFLGVLDEIPRQAQNDILGDQSFSTDSSHAFCPLVSLLLHFSRTVVPPTSPVLGKMRSTHSLGSGADCGSPHTAGSLSKLAIVYFDHTPLAKWLVRRLAQ